MNAARRARKKAQPDRRSHPHLNRQARTLMVAGEDGKAREQVTRCPHCRPPAKDKP